jgi:hypothetical protein
MWAGYRFFSYLLEGVQIRDFRKYFRISDLSGLFRIRAQPPAGECGRILIHTTLKVRWLPISGKIRHFLRELVNGGRKVRRVPVEK